MTAREIVAWSALAVTAAALAAVVLRPQHSSPAAEPAPVDAPNTQLATQLTRIESRLERLEDLQRAKPAAATVAAAGETQVVTQDREADDPAPQPDATSVHAMEQSRLAATAVVNRAIQAGYWSRKDAEAWTAAAGSLRGEERFELHRRLIVEVNADRVKVEPGASIR